MKRKQPSYKKPKGAPKTRKCRVCSKATVNYFWCHRCHLYITANRSEDPIGATTPRSL